MYVLIYNKVFFFQKDVRLFVCMFHRLISFSFVIITPLTLLGAPFRVPLIRLILLATGISAFPKLIRLPPRWFHLNVSSLCTCLWCALLGQIPRTLFFGLWWVTIGHFLYRCLLLSKFRRAAVHAEDIRYLMVPTFGPFACTILAEIAKFNVYFFQRHPEKAAFGVALGSCLSIYGTILMKQVRLRPWYHVYNLFVTIFTFLYMHVLNET